MARNFFGFNDKVDRLMEEAIKDMREKGAEIIDPANIETEKEIGDIEFDVLLYEFKDDLNRYLSNLPASVASRSLTDLIAFNEANKDKEMPWFGQELFTMADKKGPLTDKVYLKEVADLKRLAGKEGIDATTSEKQTGCNYCTYRRSLMEYRLGKRRPFFGRKFRPGCLCWLSGHNSTGGIYIRTSCRDHIYGPCLE